MPSEGSSAFKMAAFYKFLVGFINEHFFPESVGIFFKFKTFFINTGTFLI